MICDIQKQKKKTRLKVLGPVLIGDASDFHGRLKEALDLALPLEVDCREVTDFDLSGVQLLLATRKEALKNKVPFSLSPPLPATLLDLFRDLGIDFCLFKETQESPGGLKTSSGKMKPLEEALTAPAKSGAEG